MGPLSRGALEFTSKGDLEMNRIAFIVAAILIAFDPASAGRVRKQTVILLPWCAPGNELLLIAKQGAFAQTLARAKCEELPKCVLIAAAWPDSVIYARTLGYPDVLAWLREVLAVLQPDPFFTTDALSFVEVALRRKDRTLLVHLVNGNPGRDLSHAGTDDLWVDDIPPVGPIQIQVRCARAPREVHLEPGHQKLHSTFKDGRLRVQVPRLEIHGCVAIAPYEK